MIINVAINISLKISNGEVDKNNRTSQFLPLRCDGLHTNKRLRNIGISYKLQPSLLKQELDHDEIYEDIWESKKDEWFPFITNDVSSTVFP